MSRNKGNHCTESPDGGGHLVISATVPNGEDIGYTYCEVCELCEETVYSEPAPFEEFIDKNIEEGMLGPPWKRYLNDDSDSPF